METIQRHALGKRLLKPAAYVLSFLLLPLGVGLTILFTKLQYLQQGTPAPLVQALPAPPPHDPSRLTAVILANNRGTEITDFLPPYEILASTGAFNVYAVAPERQVSPLATALWTPSGLDLVPHYAFGEYDRSIGTAPDLIVIPFFPGYDSDQERAMLTWIRTYAGEHTLLLTICAGTEVLADTGLLDGHRATSHHRWIERLAPRHPDVQWEHGVRYVEDGNVISSAGLLSGVDATLAAVARLLGREVAEDVAVRLNYPHTQFLDDPAFSLPALDLRAVPQTAFRIRQADVGVLLYEGVSELALAAVLDTYVISAVKTHTVAPERVVITSRHGLHLVPRWSFNEAPLVDRLLLPGGDADPAAQRAAEALGLPVERVPVTEEGPFAYDAVLQDIAHREKPMIAAAAATNLVYPAEHLHLDKGNALVSMLLRPFALGLLGLGLAVAFNLLVAAWRRRQKQALPSMQT